MAGNNYIGVPVLSVCEEVFKGKNPGEADKTMYKLYVADARGRVGAIYSAKLHKAGEIVRLGIAERDGKLKLAMLG